MVPNDLSQHIKINLGIVGNGVRRVWTEQFSDPLFALTCHPSAGLSQENTAMPALHCRKECVPIGTSGPYTDTSRRLRRSQLVEMNPTRSNDDLLSVPASIEDRRGEVSDYLLRQLHMCSTALDNLRARHIAHAPHGTGHGLCLDLARQAQNSLGKLVDVCRIENDLNSHRSLTTSCRHYSGGVHDSLHRPEMTNPPGFSPSGFFEPFSLSSM
jgi:hypothetical protein